MTTKARNEEKTNQIDPSNITEYGIRIVMDEEKILRCIKLSMI